MKDEMRTKEDLAEELSVLRGEVARLKRLDSERKKTEGLLQESAEQYRLLFENTSDVVYSIDEDFRILTISPSVERVLGYRCEEIIGKYAYDMKFLPPESLEKGLSDILRILKGETVAANNYEFIAKDGTRRIGEISGAPLIREGKITGVICVARDRTELKRPEEAAQKAMSLLSATIESTADGILVIDTKGGISTFNKKFLSMWRIPESLTAQRADNVLLDYVLSQLKDPEAFIEKVKQLYSQPEANSFDVLEFKDGRVFERFSQPQRLGNEITGRVWSFREITDRRRMEEEQRLSRETAERFAEETAVIAEIGRLIGSTLDIEEVYERFAAEARKLIPFDRIAVNRCNTRENTLTVAYVSGMDISNRKKGDYPPLAGTLTEEVMRVRTGLIIQPESIDEIVSRIPALSPTFQAGLRSLLSVPLISRDEVIGALHFRSKKMNAYTERDLRLAERIGAQIAGAIVNAQLFNDLNKTEKSLRESEGRFRALVDNAAVGVAEIENSTSRFITVNRRLCEMVGMTEEELLATTFHAITHPEDIPLSEEKRALLFAGKIGHYSREKRYLRKDGGIVWVNITISPLWRPGETPERNMSVIEDITERKRMEEEKRSLEERLQRAEKMETVGQLAGGVAHDLNNVLGILSGYSELLLEEIPEGHRSRSYVEKILQSTEKGAAIIQDLLTMAGRGVMASDVINLSSVVSGFLKTPIFDKLQAYHPYVTFRTECDKNLLQIKGSPVHLEKTLMNLVSNAAESISGKGEVTIRTENRYLDEAVRGYEEVKEGDYAVLTVSDTGMGIPHENKEKIFEPFYTKKTIGRSGTGMGLSIVWGTVKDHHGYIDVQTEVGKGTTLTLYFPVTREELIAQQLKAPIERYLGKGESVLVVDDIAEQRDVAARLLTRLGYEIHLASSGEEAVEYLKGNKPDILVLDMIMTPGIDGLETYQNVLAINPKQKAIIVSGFSATDRVREAQKLGAGAYVKKPYIMERIGMAVRQELDRN